MEGINNNAPLSFEELLKLKHDIKNQLSNIQLALEGLSFDITENPDECDLYLDSMAKSAEKIDKLLNIIS
ncbi:hypothetical protein [Mucilaginibacter segetis]|uniref:Uncharacterized protein n=1 Tax=Mucilaginibacter segetis TaxID=2793071 RepID=A0A934PSX6_9SPHI|nr:hypothetical protein [Mucilaginibacter segetis]MBK0380223.1 hypothetical protein [Mucilaginibacter segetis]